MANAFVNIPYLPTFDKMTPAAARYALKKLIPETLLAVEELEKSLTPTWDGLVRPLNDINRPLFLAWGFFNHLKSVMDCKGWRKIEEQFLPQMVAFSQRVGQSKAFYQGYLKIREADKTKPCLNAVQRRILGKAIQTMEQSGVGLTPDRQKLLNELTLRISQCTTDFSNHLLDATKAFSLTLTKQEEVAGLPQSLLEVTAAAAAKDSKKTADAKNGPWKITLDAAVMVPFLRYSLNREARETVYRASATRASSGKIDNSGLIEEILRLRRDAAHLLGYKTYADLNLSSKMAKSVENVDRLIKELADVSLPAAKREMEGLLVFAKARGFAEPELKPWDTAFWSERQREAMYDYSDEELSQYFPFPHVLKGLFELAERLFGIVIKEEEGVPVWHKDVRFFRVNDKGGTPISCFYLDPYSRPETKLGGAWMNEFRSRYRKADGSIELPMAVLCCNQSVPVGGKPSVMRFGEVDTLFHEFGHSLQHMLTTVDEPDASGINGVEWDAVEIASQFMENWCYDRATLKAVSSHVDTGAVLPDALFDKVVAAKNYQAATAMMRQLFFAATDMDLYARYPRDGWADANAVKEEDERKYSPTPIFPEGRFLCSFSHIFAGAYAAGYYSYKWSEVISADCFAAFEEAGLDNDAAVRATGKRYRDTFLSLGGGTGPDEVFRAFRGRDPSVQAILRQNGLLPR